MYTILWNVGTACPLFCCIADPSRTTWTGMEAQSTVSKNCDTHPTQSEVLSPECTVLFGLKWKILLPELLALFVCFLYLTQWILHSVFFSMHKHKHTHAHTRTHTVHAVIQSSSTTTEDVCTMYEWGWPDLSWVFPSLAPTWISTYLQHPLTNVLKLFGRMRHCWLEISWRIPCAHLLKLHFDHVSLGGGENCWEMTVE